MRSIAAACSKARDWPLLPLLPRAAAKDAVAAPAGAQPQHTGYRESEHVRTYYKLARF